MTGFEANGPGFQPASPAFPPIDRRSEEKTGWEQFPWWAAIIGLVMASMAMLIILNDDYTAVFRRILPGVWSTLRVTLYAFSLAFVLGLATGMGQVSKNVVLHNISRAYVELVRGIPILPLIFTVALVLVPTATDAARITPGVISFEFRAIIALALIYGAYMAEIFRGGIQSIPPGQIEAGRSLGMSHRKTMKRIVIPQAMRAIIPPLGNDFIAILKDTSLLSTLGILELTLRSRQYAASTFKFQASYFVLTFVYLVLVLGLSFLLGRFEAFMTKDRKGQR